MIDADLVKYLGLDATFSAAVGGRIEPGQFKQGQPRPSCTYVGLETDRSRHLTGKSGLDRKRYRFHFWADTHETAVDVAAKFRAAVDDKTRITVDGTFISYMRVENDSDSPEDPAFAEAMGVQGVFVELVVWFKES